MNERIRELAEQSGVEFDESFSSEPETIYYLGLSHFEKFAELIIKEAIDVVNKRYMGDNNREDFEVRRCVEDLKNHFGVE